MTKIVIAPGKFIDVIAEHPHYESRGPGAPFRPDVHEPVTKTVCKRPRQSAEHLSQELHRFTALPGQGQVTLSQKYEQQGGFGRIAGRCQNLQNFAQRDVARAAEHPVKRILVYIRNAGDLAARTAAVANRFGQYLQNYCCFTQMGLLIHYSPESMPMDVS